MPCWHEIRHGPGRRTGPYQCAGCRHAKRWQDVEELLDAGIDVYTTLNIQHFESLKDVVAQMTGVIVHETLPDRLMDDASDIEVIDIPPEELLSA